MLGALAAIVKLVRARVSAAARTAERTGLGADQRAVLRLLVAGTGVGLRCGRPRCAPCAKRRSTCATCRSCGWSPRRWPNARGRRITFGGLAIIVAVWTLDALMQAVSGTSPLFFGIDAIKQLISGARPCAAPEEIAAARSPQRRARPVQPQARAGAGQPVAVRAAMRRARASARSAGCWPRPPSAW